MPAIMFVLLAFTLLVAAVPVIDWWLVPRRRVRRLLWRATWRRLGEVEDGARVVIRGVARGLGQPLTGPITGRSCIGYWMQLDGLQFEGKPIAHGPATECRPFEIAADGLIARVEGPFVFGLDIDERGANAPKGRYEIVEILARRGWPRHDLWGGISFQEAILQEGDPIRVLGRVSVVVDPRGQRDHARAQPVTRVIRGSDREPTVLADDADVSSSVVT